MLISFRTEAEVSRKSRLCWTRSGVNNTHLCETHNRLKIGGWALTSLLPMVGFKPTTSCTIKARRRCSCLSRWAVVRELCRAPHVHSVLTLGRMKVVAVVLDLQLDLECLRIRTHRLFPHKPEEEAEEERWRAQTSSGFLSLAVGCCQRWRWSSG